MRNVLTMSFAPHDSHEAQVQFALERGVPAFIGVLGTMKLPFPSWSFDLAHCSHCLVRWTSNGKELRINSEGYRCHSTLCLSSVISKIHSCHK
jgi:Putative S-adenosyl-L-methionine-dependent methyltransferase